MGAFWSLLGYTEKRAVVLGLDGAGKTTLLYNLKLGDVVRTIPTIGFNVERVNYKRCEFLLWDIGGQTRMRNLWHHYLTNTDVDPKKAYNQDQFQMKRSKDDVLLEVLLLVPC